MAIEKPTITQSEGCFEVSGDLLFATVTPLLGDGETLFRTHGDLLFDFQAIRHSDSAGLALLLEWLALARRRGVRLRYRNLPESLLGVARLSNAEHLLAIGND